MKKTLIAAAIAASMVSATAMAGATVYGSVEQTYQSQDGVHNVVNGDSYVGVVANEDLANGLVATANIGLSVDNEASTGNATSIRDGYVGISGTAASVKIGRMTNVQGVIGDLSVDVFETNAASIDVDGAARADNTVAGSISLGSVDLVGSHTADGSTNDDKQDSYEIGAITKVGAVDAGVAYAKNQNTGTDTVLVGASVPLTIGLTVGAAWERDETTAGVETDSTTITGSYDIGSNTVKVGHKDADGSNDRLVVEGVHKFSANTSAFASVVDEDTAEEIYSVGMRVKF